MALRVSEANQAARMLQGTADAQPATLGAGRESEMTALQQLKRLTLETDAEPVACDATGCPVGDEPPAPTSRMYTDQELLEELAMHDGDVRATAYDVLLRKAENTEITLPGGMHMPDQQRYWLRLAARLRKNHTHNAPRADDFPPAPPHQEGGKS